MMNPAIASELVFQVFFPWCLLLCYAALWIGGHAVAMKKKSYLAGSCLLCLFCCLELQILLYSRKEYVHIIFNCLFEKASRFPSAAAGIFLLAGTIMAAGMLIEIRKWGKNHITPLSIQECGDGHPAGILFWNNNGRVLYSNAVADSIAFSLTGRPVLSGIEFWNGLEKSPIKLNDGSVWNYRHRILLMEGELTHELIFINITELYRETEELEENTRRLQKMKDDLLEYSRQVEDLVRRKEILVAKVRIHDEMNRLLTATGRTFEEADPEKQDEILKLWEKNMSLMIIQQEDEHMENIIEDLHTYGELLGIEFNSGELKGNPDMEQIRFIVLCAREAMNNAVKHGGARRMYADFEAQDGRLVCTFINDGKRAEGRIIPRGGLLHLKEETEKQGGTFEIRQLPEFQLIITIPLERKE